MVLAILEDRVQHLEHIEASEGSEIETQINMEMMRNMNLYVYFSAHTGSNDIVLPWKITGEFAVPIADWDLYEYFLNESANVSGLTYRDPGGAGESIAWLRCKSCTKFDS